MAETGILIIDVGKTIAKATLLGTDGQVVARRTRPNERLSWNGLAILDESGIGQWLENVLPEMTALADVTHVVPVGHGAAAAIVEGGRLKMPPLDYEQKLGRRADYESQRDSFALTGSPALPDGLNLGAQLHYLEARDPALLAGGALILPWAQYWAWRLTGTASSEVSSLGCHTDLWHPHEGRPSRIAERRGWASRLAPLRSAAEIVGPMGRAWSTSRAPAEATRVLCGLHDSNAALLAARGFAEIGENEVTVLSTGTWFVAMRSPGVGADSLLLDEARDCLFNVDVNGRPIPSARFMGGREIQLLLEDDGIQLDDPRAQQPMMLALPEVLASGAAVLPTMVPGVGPFPSETGRWVNRPDTAPARAAALALYVALVADASLDLIGARDRILVEGRFAGSEPFVRALAALRPESAVLAAQGELDLAFGAARLVCRDLPPPCPLARAVPLEDDLGAYRARWQSANATRLNIA